MEATVETLPVIAIVGRPNVGKSSLLNRIVGYRHAIVDSTSGVTRDRNYANATWNGKTFEVVDTGGLDPDDNKPLMQAIRMQLDFALAEADVVLFLCDNKCGLVPDDKTILNLLRKQLSNKPLFVAVNKIDNPSLTADDFYELGVKTIHSISAVHGHGVADLLDDLVECMQKITLEASSGDELSEKIAIVGKPNVGKSSLFNRLTNSERSIVDDVPGTTRDSITVKVRVNDDIFNLIDTAGLRRPDRDKDSVEQLSVYRTLGVIKRTDLAVLVLDASEKEISNQDKRIAGRIIDSGAGCVIVWNKWDINKHSDKDFKDYVKLTREQFPLLAFAPIISISAKTGLRVNRLFSLVKTVQENGKKRLSNQMLKTILYDSVTMHPPPPYRGREIKMRSLIQLNGPPVVFKLKCSEPAGVHFSYQRYLLNNIRQEETFDGWPIKIITGK